MAIIIGPGGDKPGADGGQGGTGQGGNGQGGAQEGPAAPEGVVTPPGAGPQQPGPGAAGGDVIKEGSIETFMQDVVDASAQVPVIVDFWAPWCGPCKQLGPMLEKLVRQAGGAVRMVKINVDENPEIAQQLRVQSIPTVYAFRNGQPVDAFQGALPESQLKQFIQRLMGDAKSPVDDALAQAHAALEAGRVDEAEALFIQVLKEDTSNTSAVAGMIRCATAKGEVKEAREMIDGLTDEIRMNSEVQAAISAVELAQQSTEASADVAQLMEKVAHDENDHQARYDLAMALYGSGQNEAAINELIEIVSRDRTWNDEAARKQLLKIFEALGHTHPQTVEGRRRLSAVLFS